MAAAAVRWRDGARRAQVWGPDPAAARRRVTLVTLPAADRPAPPVRRFGTLPGPRPASPPPAAPPAWDPASSRRDRHEYHLRVWSPATGWTSAGWHSSRLTAAVTAAQLCVGVDGFGWEFGDVWGPPRYDHDLPKRALMDVTPDRLPDEPQPPVLVTPAGSDG